jgi:hypothetical protein
LCEVIGEVKADVSVTSGLEIGVKEAKDFVPFQAVIVGQPFGAARDEYWPMVGPLPHTFRVYSVEGNG